MKYHATKYHATATRRNISGKPDYAWVYAYTNGQPVEFDSATAALHHATQACEDASQGLYNPQSKEQP